ncbi:tetratricopeptide repeat protein [Neptuniibacter caesariensis]|uniref:TPR repeat protein n=1 Tax=Neptuniibacter caesariensis TaxID=207954 RepID=A0A7U8GRN1_NEPCE|nr:tetratricopeptide repeat protein [Neptuniibacter caesariensis]EAR60418.1 TPR repeat protein [Oceanospirillum sp. MED92] [Neptuniibacter caesariensis]
MLKFEVNTGKRLLKTTIGTLVSSSLLVGCGALNQVSPETQTTQHANNKVTEEYCYKGGRSNDYSCDPEKASAQADLRPKEINEEWMNSKLAEVKKWIAQEKQAILSGQPSEATAAGPTEKQVSNTNSYITTVSVSTPIASASTPEIEHILRLSHEGQHREALASVNTLLSHQPKMASAQLTKGIVLSNMGDKTEAKRIFKDLTVAFPDRPEAFNNLAVIYSEEGNYPKAIETLQQAFQTHPSYAQVHTNLKELYATLASQAYNKALDLGSASSGPDLAMINQAPTNASIESPQLVVASNTEPMRESNPVTTKPISVESTAIKEEVAVVEVSSPTIVVETQKETSETAEVDTTQQAAQAVKVQLADTETENTLKEPTITTPVPEESVSADIQEISAEEAIKQHLLSWSKAWSAKDYQGYIDSYTAEYRPNAKLTHSQWTAQRQARLSKPKFIKVSLNDIKVKLLRDNLAEAKFEQRYQSDTYKDAVRKRIMLIKTDDEWKISLERSLGLIN